MKYTELQVTSNFSFLRGGSHPEELVKRAMELGYDALAVTDRNTLAGVVRAHAEARQQGIRLIVGCRLDLLDGCSLLAYPTNLPAYARLCTLLSTGNLRAEKGSCYLYKADVYQHAEGILFVAVPPDTLDVHFELDTAFQNDVKAYYQAFGKSFYVAATRSYLASDAKRLYRLAQLTERWGIPLVATNDVHYHVPERRELQDVLTCIREKCTIEKAGYRLHQNAERYLKSMEEMKRLFANYPAAIRHAQELADRCTFSLDELKYQYPEEIVTEGRSPQEELERLTWEGANQRFEGTIPYHVRKTIEMELDFIARKDYASYFLTVYDYVREANARKILCQGRGSAANSTVCYCLGITSVNPANFRLLFARFMSDARNEPPDIDVDFEHERREEIMQYIYEKYGRDRAGIVATVTQVHWRGAIRDVGKVMGLSADKIQLLASSAYEFTEDWWNGKQPSSDGFDATDQHLRKVIELTRQYIGFPRQLGQHTGGFVITRGKLTSLCPVLHARMANRTNIEWNKDDIETLGFMKVDVLALGMLTCIRKAFDWVEAKYGKTLTLATIPQDDPRVYAMITHADTIGVFQIESRAQMSMLPRLKPTCFYDLVIEVAIVRPGPIQGDMVHPYLRRREGKDPVEYPSEELKEILGRTLGVPLFQEQAMEIAIVAAGFTPSEADGLRRSMATFKAKGKVSDWEKRLVEGMIRNGYEESFARRVFRQLEGFGAYGFPESHAASFALLVYVSSWIKCYYPDVFAVALLNSQPMGFYQPAQLVRDARDHGVEVRPVDVNHSQWDHILEEKAGDFYALRLGFRQVSGLSQDEVEKLVSGRGEGYTHVQSVFEAGVSLTTLERLADADAFRSLSLDRRQSLWEVSALKSAPKGMFAQQLDEELDQGVVLPTMELFEHVWEDYATTSLSLKAHPVHLVRRSLDLFQVLSAVSLKQQRDGSVVKLAGLILVRQRPSTASGVMFITLEDETGTANLVVFSKVFDQFRKEILRSKLLMVEGKVQVEGEVIHLIVHRCVNMSGLFDRVKQTEDSAEQGAQQNVSDPSEKRRTKAVLPKGRNFH